MRIKTHQLFIILSLALTSLTSCYQLNPSIMFRTQKDYKYTPFSDSLTSEKEYKLVVNDEISFQIYSRSGFSLVDITTLSSTSGARGTAAQSNLRISYVVEHDGMVNMPSIGRINLEGLTLREAEFLLEEKYTPFYKDPFVILRVENRRAIIFQGDPGGAQVVPLINNNTRLIEALPQVGGLSGNGKAHRIKLIRGDLAKPEVYKIDLSRIEGLPLADITLQGNDIIYVEPRRNISSESLQEITPILSLFTALVTTYLLITRTL